jgi:hypothetical protein
VKTKQNEQKRKQDVQQDEENAKCCSAYVAVTGAKRDSKRKRRFSEKCDVMGRGGDPWKTRKKNSKFLTLHAPPPVALEMVETGGTIKHHAFILDRESSTIKSARSTMGGILSARARNSA